MHSLPPHIRPRFRGFTLVEIMVVVALIGLLAILAIPAFLRVRQSAQNNRFISDLRTFAQAFEGYSLQNGSWPATTADGVVPAGMTGDVSSQWLAQNSVGGRWGWQLNGDVVAGISANNVTATDAQMALIDARIDDGDLASGLFQKFGTRFTYILEN